jgi:hypothetical protein
VSHNLPEKIQLGLDQLALIREMMSPLIARTGEPGLPVIETAANARCLQRIAPVRRTRNFLPSPGVQSIKSAKNKTRGEAWGGKSVSQPPILCRIRLRSLRLQSR